MSIGVVILGCGWAGTVHARLLSDHPDVNIVAVVDADYNRAQELAAKVGSAAFDSLDKLLDSTLEFEAASVCTPLASHFAVCKTLLELGKHVFCEKPLTSDLEEAELLGKLMHQHDADLRINFNQRFAAPIQKLKEHIIQDQVVHMAKISMFQHPPQVEEATDKYFLINEACCHLIDTLLFLNGDIQEVHAYGRMLNSPILSDVTVNLAFTNGSIGAMTNTFVGGIHDSQHPFHHVEVITKTARYFVDNLYDSLWIHPHHDLNRTMWAPSVFALRNYDASMQASIWAWVDTLLGKGDSAVSFAQGKRNMEIVDAIIGSLTTGGPVEV